MSEERTNCLQPSGSRKFTTDDFDAVWHYHANYFVDVLNGDYPVEEAREDLRGLIGSKWDPRVSLENAEVRDASPRATTNPEG